MREWYGSGGCSDARACALTDGEAETAAAAAGADRDSSDADSDAAGDHGAGEAAVDALSRVVVAATDTAKATGAAAGVTWYARARGKCDRRMAAARRRSHTTAANSAVCGTSSGGAELASSDDHGSACVRWGAVNLSVRGASVSST